MPTPDHEVPRELLPEYNLGHESYGWPIEALRPPSWWMIKQQRKIGSGVDSALQGHPLGDAGRPRGGEEVPLRDSLRLRQH